MGTLGANEKMKRKIICIFLMTLLSDPSSALKMRTGYENFLTSISVDKLADFISELGSYLDAAVDAGLDYGPGRVFSLRYPLSNGYSMMVWLTNFNLPTCNLGKGGEMRHPLTSIGGVALRSITLDWLLPAITDLLVHSQGYGFAIENQVTLFYFPVEADAVQQPSDDDPASHHHELFEVDSLKNSSNRTALSDGRKNNVGASLASSSSNSTSFFTLSTPNISSGSRSRSFTLPPLPEAHGAISSASNSTNGTTLTDKRKFPIDSNGDCDLPSLILMYAVGPTYDDQSTHPLQQLNPTDKIWSPNGRFMLVMQLDCNLVLYDTEAQTSLWASDTQDEGSVCYATLTLKGELIVYDQIPDNILFRTFTWCSGNDGDCWTSTLLQVQDDGNLVLYIFDTGYPMFASNTVVCEGGCDP